MKCEVKSSKIVWLVNYSAPLTPDAPGICPALSNGCYATAYEMQGAEAAV